MVFEILGTDSERRDFGRSAELKYKRFEIRLGLTRDVDGCELVRYLAKALEEIVTFFS